MKARPELTKLLCLALLGLFFVIGCAAKRTPTEASQLVNRGELAKAAIAYEHIARKSSGAEAAEAWYQAGKLWIDPDNKKLSFRRALACFKRIDTSVVDEQIARDTRLWIFLVTRVIAAEDAASASKKAAAESKKAAATLKDVTEGSEQLQAPPAP